MEIGLAGPIFTQEKSKSLLVNYIRTAQYGEKRVLAILHIYGVEAIFYYFMITKTLNLSHKKYKLVYIDQYSPR